MAKLKIRDKKVKVAIMKDKRKKDKGDPEAVPELLIESYPPTPDEEHSVLRDVSKTSDFEGSYEINGDEEHHSAEESDSSEDEVAPRNTIGDVPLEWYKDEEHIGYDIAGRKIKKHARKDKIESFLAGVDDSKNWRKIYDEYNDEEVELTKKELKLIKRMLKGSTPHTEVDPYAPYVDWFDWEDKGHPLSNAPEPKRRFIPSKWEHKKLYYFRWK